MANIYSTITYNANLSPAQAQIKALTGQIAGLTTAFNALDKSAVKAQASLASTFMANVGQIGAFDTRLVKVNSTVDDFGKALQGQRLTMRQYFREAIAGYTKQNSLMRQLAEQQVRYQQSMMLPLGAGADGSGRAFVMTPKAMDSISKSTSLASAKFSIFNELVNGGATRLLNFGKNTQWAGRQLMVGFTLPMALFTATVSKQFRDLDKELTRFQKVYGQDLGNAVGDATLRMREQIKTLAFDISRQYGIAATETAALAADIAATGAEGEKLVSSVQQTTRLAVLGEVDRQEAMKTTLALQTAFKMNTNELAESINFLNAVENQTSTTLQDFATAIPKVGPVVKSLGGDIEDLAMMLVAMREGGVPAAEAANAIKSGLASMINPTKKAADVAAEFGINLRKIVDDNKGQLMPTIYAMQDALQNLDDFGRARVIEEIFGKYQFARMSALFSNLGKMGSQTEAVLQLTANSATELASIANQELKVLQESTAMRFQRTLEELRNILIPIGETLTETLIPIFQLIGEGAKKFIEFFQALPEPVKNFAKYGAAIAALAGPVIMLVGLFGNLIANGLRFGMMIVRLGARIGGLKVEKFELLNAETVAARKGVEGLTTSFMTQENALKRLAGAMNAYNASLRTLYSTNPALFMPGAGRPPIRRASGSYRPEFVPGSGRGDKIPAMLEPGEFVVNRKATEKYAPVLMAMNRGNLPGFVNGTETPVEIAKGTYSAPSTIASRYPVGEGMARGHIFGTGREAKGLKIGGDYFLWHKKFWVEISNEENQLMNILQLSTKKNQPLFQKTLQDMNVDQVMTERIMAKIRSGVMFSEEEAKVAHAAIRKLAVQIDQGQISAKQMTPALGRYAAAVSQLPKLSALTIEQLRAAEQQLITGITSISTTSGPNAVRARAILAEKLNLVRGVIQQVGQAPVAISQELQKILQITSPSRIFELIGRQVGQGAIKGFESGIPSARAAGTELGREIILGVQSVQGSSVAPGTRGTFVPGASGLLLPGGMVPVASPGLTPGSLSAPTRFGNMTPEERRTLAAARRQAAGYSIERPGDLRRLAPNTGPSASIQDAQERSRVSGASNSLMNAAFAGSMLVSTFSMMSGASSEASEKLMMFSTALMAATAAAQLFQGRNVMGNFMGLGSLGGKIAGKGAAMAGGQVATTAAGRLSGVATFGAARGAMAGGQVGAGLLMGAGRALSVLGGPIGIAAGLAITGGIAAFMAYQNAAEEARKRAIAAFEDPVKSAEFFGLSIQDVGSKIEEANLSSIDEDLTGVDESLREAVKEDYGALIQRIRNVNEDIGAQELSKAFSNMLLSGLTAEQARDAIEAISVEAGEAGGKAFAKASAEGMLNEMTPKEAMKRLVSQFDPSQNTAIIDRSKQRLSEINRQRAELEREYTILLGLGYSDDPAVADERAARVAEISEELKRLRDEAGETEAVITELTKINLSAIVPIVESLIFGYEQDPSAAIEAMDEIVARVNELRASGELTAGEENQILRDISNFMKENNPEQWALYGRSIDTADEALAAMAMTIAGIPLSEAINDAGQFDIALANAAVGKAVAFDEITISINNLRSALQESLGEDLADDLADIDVNIADIDNNISTVNRNLRIGIERLQKEFEITQKAAEDAIDAKQDEIDLIQDAIDAKREETDEKISGLEEEKKNIQESTDAYINSIKKRQRADSFYVNQRKSAFGALQKLASGDIFGFLQAREEMGGAARNFAFDNEIQSIEDKRDAEIKAIDDVIEAERKRQEDFEKLNQDRIDLIRDQIDAERDAMDAAQEAHDQKIKNFTKEKRERLQTLKLMKQDELDKRRETNEALDKINQGQLLSAEELANLLGEQRAKPYILEQKEILKTEMLKKYIEMQGKYPEKSASELQQLAYYELIDLFNSVYGAAGRINDLFGRLEDIGFNPPSSSGNTNTGSNTTGSGSTPGSSNPGGAGSPNRGNNRAQGGYISGPGTGTSDSIPARLSNGEYVVKASSVSKYGRGMMDAINEQRFATGGLVGDAMPRFVEGRAFPSRTSSTKPGGKGGTGGSGTGGTPDPGSTGDPTPLPSTSTNLIGHPSQGGPNKWPYYNYPKGSGTVPGTSRNLYLNKDVLPLFLAFSSDYNRLIRPINTIYGISARSGNYSNHPSGTAVDINPGQEGQFFGWGQSLAQKYAVLDWWRGKKSSLAPWDSKSPIPYRTVNALMDKYKILQWFGPRSLGGFINDELGMSDPMHFQITQSRTVSPGQVASTISSLGINPDGTFNRPNTYAAGGLVKGRGGPRSDMVPAMLSNGEYVVKAGAVNKYGRGMLDQINAGNFNLGSASQPEFNMPTMPATPSGMSNYGGDTSNVKIVINGASGKSAAAIANKVASMINSSNNRRNHSRSI